MIISAEVGQAHEGSLGTALAYVKAIAAAGADCAKWQDHRGDLCDKFRPNTYFPQDHCRRAYWERTAFTQPEWTGLRMACQDYGLEYVVSCFSMEAFKQQAELEPDRWKIASSKVNDHELIDACVKTGKPVIVSSGLAEHYEFRRALKRIESVPLTILACVSQYPVPAECTTFDVCDAWTCERGISDHSGTIWPSIVAASRRMDMCEVHVAFSRECFGPDVSSSITIAELKQLVEGVRFIERMGTEIDFSGAVKKEMREVFGVA